MEGLKSAVSVKAKMWRASLALAAGLYVVFFFYLTAYYGEVSYEVVAGAFAASAAILFGLSFAMSGFAFYFDFLDPYVAYRKYFGLTGFWFALVYSVLLAVQFPEKYLNGLPQHLGTADVLLGLGAMAIFGLMALVSTASAMKLLGVKIWRSILRLGYVAYAMLMVRAYLTEKETWSVWWSNPDQGLPPARILLSLIVIAVILLRLSIVYSKWRRKKETAVPKT